MNVVFQDMEKESTESLDQLLKIITVWRQRLTNMSDAMNVEEVVSQLEYWKETDEYHTRLINQSIFFVSLFLLYSM